MLLAYAHNCKKNMIALTLLSENTVRGAGLLGEHGLAYWLDTGTHRVLFDTGQGMALQPNAAKLGIDLGRADAIVLSHGHYDHVSGLPMALQAAPAAELWFHPAWALVIARGRMPSTACGASSRLPASRFMPDWSGRWRGRTPRPRGGRFRFGFSP